MTTMTLPAKMALYSVGVLFSVLVAMLLSLAIINEQPPKVIVGQTWHTHFAIDFTKKHSPFKDCDNDEYYIYDQNRTVLEVRDGWVKYQTDNGLTMCMKVEEFVNDSTLETERF